MKIYRWNSFPLGDIAVIAENPDQAKNMALTWLDEHYTDIRGNRRDVYAHEFYADAMTHMEPYILDIPCVIVGKNLQISVA